MNPKRSKIKPAHLFPTRVVKIAVTDKDGVLLDMATLEIPSSVSTFSILYRDDPMADWTLELGKESR